MRSWIEQNKTMMNLPTIFSQWKRPMFYPVVKTGVYHSIKGDKLEFWFFFTGKTACCGECRLSATDAQKSQWENECHSKLRQLVIDKFNAKPIVIGHG